MANQADNRQQDDGSQQRDEHGWNCDRIVDRTNLEDRAQEVASNESTNNSHHDIDQAG